ncbi:HipA family kinase [Neptuniibacter sp. SY11_33]|uniref:HipA family kinase n=1 Tax=unclassified Neptuniibacter TaxID=2630693 RepID=UPI0039F7261F
MSVLDIYSIDARCEFEKGFLMPFICTVNRSFYYAKGSNTQPKGLINEWVCACLAKKFGLPVPEFCLLRLDSCLKGIVSEEWVHDLGFEFLFGSKSVAPCEKITISDIENYPPDLKRDILVFDAWILNNDRMLTASGGNPNLLITMPKAELKVIDHNLAFDTEFNQKDLRNFHVFSKVLETHPIQLPEQADYCERFESVMDDFDDIVSQIPDEWLESLSCSGAYLSEIKGILNKYKDESYWGWLT